MKHQMYPVILSGGSGSRLWPISRRAHPKPFMRLLDGETMAEKTFRRALRLANDGPVMTVTSRDHFFYTRDLYQGLDENVARHPFLLEPMGRNTAPAIALAALETRAQHGADAVMLVMPADHLVRDEERFLAAAEEAAALAARGYLVTFGIHPTHPETGYGYIRKGAKLADELDDARRIATHFASDHAEIVLGSGLIRTFTDTDGYYEVTGLPPL